MMPIEEKINAIIEDLEQLAIDGDDIDMPIRHKIEEAVNPLRSARSIAADWSEF